MVHMVQNHLLPNESPEVFLHSYEQSGTPLLSVPESHHLPLFPVQDRFPHLPILDVLPRLSRRQTLTDTSLHHKALLSSQVLLLSLQ